MSHNYQWGRSYETLGTDPDEIAEFTSEFVRGAQLPDLGTGHWKGGLSSVKHYLGDGATYLGLNTGNATVYDFNAFKEVNMAGYRGGIQACTGNVMCSYSSVNRIHMAINADLLQRELKEKEGFEGFIISDYNEIGALSGGGWPTSNIKMNNQQEALISIVNAGVDMLMLSGFNHDMSLEVFTRTLKDAVESEEISIDRIDDAVTRILLVK